MNSITYVKLEILTRFGDLDMIKKYIKQYYKNDNNIVEQIFFLTLRYDQVDITKYLVNKYPKITKIEYYGEICFHAAKKFGCQHVFDYLYNNTNVFFFLYTIHDIINVYNNGYYVITKLLIGDYFRSRCGGKNSLFLFFCEFDYYDICVFIKQNFPNIDHNLVDLTKIKNPEIVEWIKMNCPIRQTSTKSSKKIIKDFQN